MRAISALGIVASWFLMGFLPMMAVDYKNVGFAILTGTACVVLMLVAIIIFKPDLEFLWFVPIAIVVCLAIFIGLVYLVTVAFPY